MDDLFSSNFIFCIGLKSVRSGTISIRRKDDQVLKISLGDILAILEVELLNTQLKIIKLQKKSWNKLIMHTNMFHIILNLKKSDKCCVFQSIFKINLILPKTIKIHLTTICIMIIIYVSTYIFTVILQL